MASVYGSKVKEPKLTRRSELPFEKQSPYAADLAQAWASFGEAKSVLQRLEQTSASPPVKDRTQRRPKPYHVYFDPGRATGAERATHYGHTNIHSSTLSSDGGVLKSKGGEGRGGKENNEYVVEPRALNELESQKNMEYEPHGANVSQTAALKSNSSNGTAYKPGRTLSNPHVQLQASLAGSNSESRSLPSSTSAAFSQRYDSTVRFSVPPTTTTLHPSPSNPNTTSSPHSRLGGTSAPYSNATAVFGPPVKFGDHTSRHVPVSSRQPTMVRPAEAPKSYSFPVHSRSHTTSTNVHPRTSTATASTQVASVGAGRSTVPIRTFELPTETLGTLRAKIELQKQAMRATSAKASSLLSSRNPTTSAAAGFYPLPDASTTATSSFASSSNSVGGVRPRVPHPPPTARPPDAAESVAKRRKVASAPPPQTYTGFSSTSGRAGTKSSSGAPTTVSWKPNLESVRAVGGAVGVALPSSLTTSGTGASRFSSQPPTNDSLEPPKRHLHMHAAASKKVVRKVHKIPATNEAPPLSKSKSTWSASGTSKPPPGASSGLITTSSWRAGKELRDKILKREDKELDRMDYHSSGSRKREDTSPAHYSSASESQSNLSSSQENISAVSSSIDVHIQPERNLSEDPQLNQGVHQTKTKDEASSRGGVALDFAGMLKDLEGSESPIPPPSPLGGGEGRERVRLGQARSTTSASGGPTSKKPRYNYEPSYPTERVRRYDQAEVQSYMQKKQEDRRKRELEEKQARERTAREREEKLKQLYESQRKRVEANLRMKQKQRLAYSKALATGDIHIHLHTGSATSSTSTIGSTADSAAPPVPTLAVHPPTPISKSPTVGSLTLHVRAGTDSTIGELPESAAVTSMLSPRHQSSPLRPSPPSHSPTPPHTSPPRYSRLGGTSPASREASRSPSVSPRTYSVPSSTSPSPKAHRSPPVSSEHAQFHHSPSTGATEHAQYGIRTEHAQYGYGSGPGQLSYLLRGPSHTNATAVSPQSREERIRALTESALRLKERIAMESKRFEEGTFGAGPSHHISTSQQRPSPALPTFSNNHGFTPSADLPGVRNVHEHALRAEKLRQETEAATKIQATYRGHCVRKSLHWKLPSGQTLGASLREGHTHGMDEGGESGESSAGTLTPPAEEEGMEKEMSTPIISPLHGHAQKREGVHVHAHVHTQPPTLGASGPQITSSGATAVPHLSPWQQTGGDEHSIINVFTRQHEKLRQTLDQLSDQKRAEIRRFGEEGRTESETPKHSTSSLPGSQPRATSISHSHSYTYTFEQASPSKSASEHSPHSSIFSEDSLHVSPPPKHKSTSAKASPLPTSSPHSHHSSPRSATSPPSRVSSSSTLTSGSPSSKSEAKLKQGTEEGVHAITPPGSPSFVESFASLSPRSVSSQTSEPKSIPKSSPSKADATAQSAKPPDNSTPSDVQVTSTTAAALPTVTVTESGGRLSPRSLELKLHSELNLLETVEDSMRQLSQVESARAMSLAQQETVALAQLLKSHQQGHEQELQAIALKSEKETEEARGKLDREAALMAEQRRRIEREHAEEMQRIREEASRASHEATLRLSEARTAASDAVIQVAKEHLEAAHKIAESAASAAAREAVKATLIVSGVQRQELSPHHHKETTTASGSITPSYESDFEADSLAGSETGKLPETQSKPKSTPTTSTRSQVSGSSTTSIEEDIEQEEGSGKEGDGEGESATPQESEEEAMEVQPGDETLVGGGSELEESYQSQSPIEEIEEDISEASFQLLPSESHRRQQQQQQARLSLQLRHRRDHSESEGSSYSRGSSPSQGEGSRVPSPMPSELSPSPGAGEDSFFQFMNRMVRAYMHEEELRARHQATLLRLREDALQEKTKAHLEWLKVKKKALQRKGDDDKMPPLARMERGLLKKYKQEQAEIHRLKEAQKAARRERSLMLQQQKEISQMRRSAQYYRNKIHQHSRRVSHSPSPSPSLLLDEIQNASSRLLDESELSMGDISVAEELSENESERNHKSLTEPLEDLRLEQSLPKEYTEDFASYTTSPEPVLTATVHTEIGSSELEGGEGDKTLTAEDLVSQQTPAKSVKPKIKVSPPDDKKSPPGGKKAKVTRTPKSPSSESHTVKELEKLAATDPHKYLSQREQRLLKRRKAAEEVLKQQQELLKKEQILDKEEEKVNKLVTEALSCYQQRTRIKKERSKDRSRHSSGEEVATSAKPRSPSELSTSPKHSKSPLEEEREVGLAEANTKSSISEEIGASGSITAEVSEQILSQMSSSQPSSAAALPLVHTVTSRGPSDYAMDTFESFQSSVSRQDHPPHPLVTSTPSSIQESLKKGPQLNDDLSVSISESVTSVTSDGSGLEERIRLLKLQLHQKKEEMKRFQTEQKRKKKAALRQQEEQLKRKLEIVENRAKQMKSAATATVVAAPSIPLHSPDTATPTSSGSATPSQAHSEKSDSEMSRESTASPQPLPIPIAELSHPPHPSMERGTPAIVTNQQKDEERSLSPASVQEQLSPVAQSYSYTPFSDSLTTGLAPTAGSGDKMDGLAHEDSVVKVDLADRKGEPLSPTASLPEEHDTSRSTLMEEEEEEDREVGAGEGEGRQQEQVTVASVEMEREKEALGHEKEPVAEELSVKSDSISEHLSDSSEEGEEFVDVEQVTQPSEMEPQVEEGTPPPLSGEQYSESFEEPSSSTPASSPSSQPPPIGELSPPLEAHEAATMPVSQAPPLKELTPPPEPQVEVAIATPAEIKQEDTTDIAEQKEHEQVDIPNSLDKKESEDESGYQLGQRVLVGNAVAGTIRYVGYTHFAEGLWIGVELESPKGRNDGSIDGYRYFSCEPKCGLFAPPRKVTVIDENPEYYDEEGEGEGERQQPPFEDDASSFAEEIEEEHLSSEHEQEDHLEDHAQPDSLDENAALQPPVVAHEEGPPPVDDMYSPDFESSPEESEEEGAEADDEEERESEAKPEDGEGLGEVQVDEPTANEERGQEKEDYQWPRSEEGTRESSPMVEFNHHVGKEETLPPAISQLLQKHQAEENRENLKTQLSETDRETEKITGEISDEKLGEKTTRITEHPPPASESLETLGEKSESFPQAPEVANQRSQSATPTPAPPPEFAEGALKETSIEPQREIQTTGETASTLKQASEVISEELAQELTNEAYETMHSIWKVKRETQLATKGQATEYEATDVMKIPLDKEAKLSLEDKADLVTDQLLTLLLQSETNLACSIHNFKKSQEEEEQLPLRIHIPEQKEEVLSPTSSKMQNHVLPRSPVSREPERLVLSPVPEEPQDDDDDQTEPKVKHKEEEQEEEVTTPPVSPLHRGAPAKLILTGTTSSIIESSPPPLSPPSPYRTSPFIPSFIPAADEFSPPGSPPKHLSQASAARVAAGEKTPFLSSQDKERKGLERSTSTESITSLLALTIKTAQCMVPSERANVDQVVERSWQVCEGIGFEHIHNCSPRCPDDILDMFSDLHELSPEENHCRRAYLELVFNLTVETLQHLHTVDEATPVWTQESAVRSLLVPEHKNSGRISLEKVQKKVYKALMRGQLPSQLPAVKFLRGMKRPGGREIDFVDTILIKELREEEPGWIDYCCDEASVKMKTADAILDSLISEAVQIMCDIGKKRRTKQNSTHS